MSHYTVEEAVAILTRHPERLALLLEDVSSPCEYPFCKRRVLEWERVVAADDPNIYYCSELHRLADAALLGKCQPVGQVAS